MSITCYLCGHDNYTKRPGKVRDNRNLEILECGSCGLVFLSSIDHINNGFYEESGMLNGHFDLQKYRNHTNRDDIRRFEYLAESLVNKSLLDFGCGAGGFLHLAKPLCSSISGLDLDRRLNEIINKENITCYKDVSEINDKFHFITLFHVLEHLPKPVETLKQLSEKLLDGGQFIIEVPSASDALLTLYNNKPFSEFTYWSCHLYLFNSHTLRSLGKKAGLKVNYIKQVQRYPLSNHLYWLANGKPGGHQQWSFLDSDEVHAAYEKQLASIGACDTLVARFSK